MPYTDAFKKLLKKMKKQYSGELVPEEYKKVYVKIYNKKDVISFTIATAKSKGIIIDKPIKKKGLYFE